LDADLSYKEVDQPSDLWCCSGHVAPSSLKRKGSDDPERPTKFFSISGKGIKGIYCEICVMVAHKLSKSKK